MAFTLDELDQAPTVSATFAFTSGKAQQIDVDDNAQQNDNWTEYLGVNVNAGTGILIVNATGWTIDIDPNSQSAPISVPPGGFWAYCAPGGQNAIDNLANYLYVLDITLSSSGGGPGKVKCFILGVS